MRRLLVVIAIGIASTNATAQTRASRDIVLEARRVGPTTPLRIYGIAGSIRLIGWDRDSLVITSQARPRDFFFAADPGGGGVKTGIDQYRFGIDSARTAEDSRPFYFVVYLPKQSQVVVHSVSAAIDASDVSGNFTTTSGSIEIRGMTATLEVNSVSGNIDLNANASWARAQTGGRGRIIVRGTVQDVDASTVDGELDVATPSVMRGRFSSVNGDIRYAATPAAGSIFDFSNHSGAVDMALPRDASAALDLSSVTGTVENGIAQARPAAGGAHSMRLTLGRGDAQMTVRTFKGTVRLRPTAP
jgi:putative adhesin